MPEPVGDDDIEGDRDGAGGGIEDGGGDLAQGQECGQLRSGEAETDGGTDGDLTAATTCVEPTSGNTGLALSVFLNLLGYKKPIITAGEQIPDG